MEIRALTPDAALLDAAVECYRAAHGTPDPRPAVAARFERHATYPGWRGHVALADFDADGTSRVVGYVYGYSSAPDQQYHRTLRDALPARTYDRWLTDCFEVVELGVHPAYRRQGLATRLHDAVLDGVPHRTAVLTTGVDNAPAQALYDRLGWVLVWEPFVPDRGPEMVVLGKDLWRPRFTASPGRRRAGPR